MNRRSARLRRLARRLGYHLVVADHYSPIAESGEFPVDWQGERPARMPGVDLRLDASLRYLTELSQYLDEYAPPDNEPGTASGYYRRNPMYGPLDAEVLYAIVRDLKPSRILDVGAGFSTLVIEDALARNSEDGAPCEHRVYDPFPADFLRGRIQVVPLPAQAIPASELQALGADDILFIDTTHTVRPGGDVLKLILGDLPNVATGVVVHIHDFFRPFEYPRFLAELGYYWQEHHLVQAFLAFNGSFEVLAANHALSRLRFAEVDALVSRLPSRPVALCGFDELRP